MSKLGPSALKRLHEDEMITVTAQRWQFDIMLRAVIERLRDTYKMRANAVHAAEESQLNQLIDCYEAILTDVGEDLGHVERTISMTTDVGFVRVPLSFPERDLREDIDREDREMQEMRDKSPGEETSVLSAPEDADRRSGEERRTRTDLTFDRHQDRRSGQDRREDVPAGVGG